MSTLYRKYRPQNFTEAVGQNHIKLTLEHEVISGKIAHAYLFCGPRAVGKTTLARVLAKAVNCEKRKAETANPCNQCLSCADITAGRALDIMEIDAASHTGVDNVRDNIIANARVAPVRAKYKVFIIDEVHMLSISAFNALLKIIEEPPERVIFILCTTEIHKVPATIISRCQRFDFKRISVSDIVKKLSYIAKAETIKIDKGILEAIARQAGGHMRDAESTLGQIVAIGGREISREEADLVIPRSDLNEVINLIGYLMKKDAGNAVRLVNKLMDEGVDLKDFISELIEILRKIMLAKINPGLADKLGMELGEAAELKINETAKDLTIEQLTCYLEKFIKVRQETKSDFIEQLPMELAIAELCFTAASPKLSPSAAANPLIRPKFNQPNADYNKTADNRGGVNTTPPDAAAKITHEQILAKWNEVLARVKQYNHSLSFILRVCQPRRIDGSKLILAFKYKFHKERIEEANIKLMVEKIINQVYGTLIQVEAVIDENMEVASNKLVSDEPAIEDKTKISQAESANGNMIDNLLKTFGGRVVS